jgi:hypothetical protein
MSKLARENLAHEGSICAMLRISAALVRLAERVRGNPLPRIYQPRH